jgi:hypothetical protein
MKRLLFKFISNPDLQVYFISDPDPTKSFGCATLLIKQVNFREKYVDRDSKT